MKRPGSVFWFLFGILFALAAPPVKAAHFHMVTPDKLLSNPVLFHVHASRRGHLLYFEFMVTPGKQHLPAHYGGCINYDGTFKRVPVAGKPYRNGVRFLFHIPESELSKLSFDYGDMSATSRTDTTYFFELDQFVPAGVLPSRP